MTRAEFLDLLARLAPGGPEWALMGPAGQLRCNASGDCTITYVANHVAHATRAGSGGYEPDAVQRAAEYLELSHDDENAIIDAADAVVGWERPLRARLLAACGLTELER